MVAKEYAKAIYDLALEENKEKEFYDAFEALSYALEDNDFIKLMSSPSIDKIEKKDIVSKVFKSLDKTFINFLYVLVDHSRFSIIADIYEEFDRLCDEKNNIVQISVTSAKMLTKKQNSELSKALEVRYAGKKIEIINIIDPSIIGGLVVSANGQAIDLTIKSSLNDMKDRL